MPLRSRPALRRAAVAAMGAAAVALSLTVVAPSDDAEAADGLFAPRLVTVDTPTREDKALLQTLGLDLTEHAGRDYVEVVLHNPLDLQRLREAGLGFDVVIPDLAARSAEINRINAAYAAATVRSPLPSGRDTYRGLADYNADMAALAEQRPDLARTFTLPRRSLDGRLIRGIEIGGNVRAQADGRPTFVLLGVHHAREWPSGELAMEFAVDLVKSYGKDARITRLLDRSRVVVVPVVNVDGFHLSKTDGRLIDLRGLNKHDPLGGTSSILLTPGNAYKRKNCRLVDGQDTPDGSCRLAFASPGGYGVGIDLNRNYGGFWGGPGASDLFLDPTYRGPKAFSEPETQNIRDLISGRQVTMMISNHTFGNLVLRPNGVHPDTIGHDGHPVGDAPDEAAMKALGARMTAANGYANIHGWELYDTTGTTEDWSYNATGGFGYTFEIGPNEFHPPFPQVVDEYLGAGKHAGLGNREAYLRALETAVDPRSHSLLRGSAPRGAVLRLTKSFETPTWAGTVADSLDTTMVSRGGTFTWHVNPSTRPVVMEKVVEKTEEQEVRSESFTGGQTTPGSSADHPFTVTAGDAADLLRVSLDWPTPDDLDLEVYRRSADGSLVQVGTSGGLPGEKELVELASPVAGDYVLRVVNYTSVTPSYALKAAVVREVVTDRTVVAGKVERWTLTCEKNGTVLQRTSVQVDRGGSASVDLAQCRRRW